MLNDRQIKTIVDEVNKDVNVPFISEKSEAQLLETAIRSLDPKIEGVMRDSLPPEVFSVIMAFLDDELEMAVKADLLTKCFQKLVGEKLIAGLNEKLDIPVLSEDQERMLFSIVIDLMMKEVIKAIMGMLDAN